MKSTTDIDLDDTQIAELFKETNFGPTGTSPIGRRGMMVESVLKNASGYADGRTINQICIEAKLLTQQSKPTKQGMRWAFQQIYKSGETVLERLARTPCAENPTEKAVQTPVEEDHPKDTSDWVKTPAFQEGYKAGMEHDAFITATPPENLRALCPYANGPAIDRWEAGFITAIS